MQAHGFRGPMALGEKAPKGRRRTQSGLAVVPPKNGLNEASWLSATDRAGALLGRRRTAATLQFGI
eukprot:15441543-Alexandrium_andersonii.AAC.1